MYTILIQHVQTCGEQVLHDVKLGCLFLVAKII